MQRKKEKIMGLTPKQEHFAQNLFSGMTQADAYRKAFGQGKYNDKTLIEAASRLSANSNVLARVKELQKTLENKALWTREDSINKLKEAFEIADKTTDIVAVTKELNAMHGYNAPVKMEIEHRGTVNIYVPKQSEDE